MRRARELGQWTWQRLMQDLMNDRDVSPDTRTFNALIRGYNFLFHKDQNYANRADVLVMQDARLRIKSSMPANHSIRCVSTSLLLTNLFGPLTSVFDPRRHGRSR